MHKNNGYECVYMPEHPSARPNGYVYKHRLIMEEKLGRRLRRWETVHHKDGDRTNNISDNLDLVSNKEHAHRHKGWKKSIMCLTCGRETKNKAFCSDICAHTAQRKVKDRPKKEELETLVWSRSVSSVSRLFGVSDSCVRKWCAGYGINNLPGRGYWQKKASGK